VIWCADTALLALTVAAGVPPGFAARVRADLAERWRVPPACVRLEWGRLAGRARLDDGAPFRLVGSGAGGRFAVVARGVDSAEVAVVVRAGVLDSAWIAARPVRAGESVVAADLRREVRVSWGAPSEPAPPPIGWEARRSLGPGELVGPPAVAPPPMIRAGERVVFQWTAAGVTIAREGVAANTARLGEAVWARDPAGGRILGTATGPGAARIIQSRRS
jgi:flagella basal body P-ring formation protein FlgA